MHRFFLLTLSMLLPTSLPAQEGDPLLYLRQTESHHNTTAWKKQEAIQANLTIESDQEPTFNGQLLMRPNAARVRVTRDDGAVAVFDGDAAWVTPASANWDSARFDVLAWAYLLALPHKLNDYGVRLEPVGQKEFQGKSVDVAEMTFDPGIGDSPDDRYQLYQDPENGKLLAAAISSPAESQVVVFDEFRGVQDITVPHRWRFYRWSEETGLPGEPLGTVTLRDVTFPEVDASLFAAPAEAREIKKAAAGP